MKYFLYIVDVKDSKRKHSGHWTKENCIQESLKYKTRFEFKKGSGGAYNSSWKNGWLGEVCSHMVELKKSSGHWTKENCKEESLKYKTRLEFKKGSVSAYNSSRRNGWLDEVCSHIMEVIKPSGHWNIKENCQKESLKYKIRSEFQKGSSAAYNSSWKNGWLDEVCKDMEVVGNLKMRGIYVFEFEDSYAYVGLTDNFKRRYSEHINKIDCVVYKHIEETNLTPKFIQLTDYMDEQVASKEETVWENKYITEGWNMLNILKTGGLGGCILKWGYDSCEEESLKYKIRSEFQKGSNGAYRSSWKNGWLDEICSHMLTYSEIRTKWTKDRCQEESLKYKIRSEFQKGSSAAYQSSCKYGWLDKICSHMGDNKRKSSGHWTKENCIQESLKYNTRSEFQKGSKGAYNPSLKNGWLDEFFPKTKKG
jgi:predicted GIY-YIG superfamily endonuclease